NETALAIGLLLIEKAKRENKKIAIDINRHGQQIFRYSFDGTTPDNDYWIAGKVRLVNRMFTSSLKYETLVKQTGKPLGEIIHSDGNIYLPGGGAFPIIIRNVGVVGTITVSGLSGYEDHMMVVDVLKEYLKVS
ncbi:MAG TPA: heme-binding protein, partial [Spirochaetota bacterium]